MELEFLKALVNAGGAVIVAVIALFLFKQVNKTHEERLVNMKKEYTMLTKMVCDIAERDIQSREAHVKVSQSLVDAIRDLKESYIAGRRL